MAVYPKQVPHNSRLWPEALRYAVAWLLVVAALFYAMHRYFEYRERELDRRIERMYTDH